MFGLIKIDVKKIESYLKLKDFDRWSKYAILWMWCSMVMANNNNNNKNFLDWKSSLSHQILNWTRILMTYFTSQRSHLDHEMQSSYLFFFSYHLIPYGDLRSSLFQLSLMAALPGTRLSFPVAVLKETCPTKKSKKENTANSLFFFLHGILQDEHVVSSRWPTFTCWYTDTFTYNTIALQQQIIWIQYHKWNKICHPRTVFRKIFFSIYINNNKQ